MTEFIMAQKSEDTIREAVEKIKNVSGDNLVSLILYGSAARGDFVEKRSNINLLIVLKDTSLPKLGKLSWLARSIRKGQITPVIFSLEYLKSSTDVFPIEFLDIKENYRVLYGIDPIKELIIETRNLRFQCEQELKLKLINIKRQYLLVRTKKELESLLFKNFASILHVLRNILRIRGIEPPLAKDQIVAMVEKELSVNTTVLGEILWAGSKRMALTYKDVDGLLTGFVNTLETITKTIDTM